MRILKLHFVLFIALSACVYSQQVKVKQITQITNLSEKESYYPKFSSDNSKIFFTTANYDGIWYYDFTTNAVTKVTDQQGAGYEFTFTPDGKNIIYRTQNIVGMKRHYSVYEQNIETKEVNTLETDKTDLYPPQLVSENKISCAVSSQVKNYNLSTNQAQLAKSANTVNRPVVIIDNSKIVLFQNGEKTVLAPLGEGNYIWPSVSPDNQKLLFTYCGHGTYVTDLNGNVISNLGYANAPQWSPDGKWIIYMVDKDNGQKVTSSEIFISSVDGTQKFQVTDTKEIHEMYPVWSVDGKKAAFNSEDGKLFIVELNID